jgi:hypothetical protein
VIETKDEDRLVITGAHCLPRLPPAHAASAFYERTYQDLLGPLGGDPTVFAECMFVDPVADLAVLGTPDNQDLWEQAEGYDALVSLDEAVIPFEIGTLSFTRQRHAVPDDVSAARAGSARRSSARATVRELCLGVSWPHGKLRRPSQRLPLPRESCRLPAATQTDRATSRRPAASSSWRMR